MLGGTIAVSQADAVGWICLVVGIGVLGAGVQNGLRTSQRHASKHGERAKAMLEQAHAHVGHAKTQLETVADPNLESPAAAAEATAAAEAAEESVDAAKTAFEQVGDIVGSLPENLRFAGLLVLVGTVLIGVATVQFGGVSLF